MSRKQWSKSDTKEFLSFHPFAEQFMTKKSSVFQDGEVLFVDGIPSFFRLDSSWVPTLHLMMKFPDLIPSVTVDKGAIKFVVNGADIMRPGITASQEFAKAAVVVIIDENYQKPLAVGRALFSSSDLMACKEGKVIANLHRVGDGIWQKQ